MIFQKPFFVLEENAAVKEEHEIIERSFKSERKSRNCVFGINILPEYPRFLVTFLLAWLH
jgi:hypothetical protein